MSAPASVGAAACAVAARLRTAWRALAGAAVSAAASALLALGLWGASAPAIAGRACEARAPDATTVERAMALALNTARALDATGAQVVVLARVGQDLRRHGLRYSHLGLAYREGPAGDGSGVPGVWRVAHKLNQCGSAQAALYRHGLAEFFLDDLFDFEAGVVVLQPELQARLLPVLTNNRRLARLHTPAYSMVAYPWSTRYQQSNQWAIETLAMAQEPAATTRERAQAWLKLQGYEPTTLRLGAFTRLGARVSAANVAFDDHPDDKRFSDRIETITVDSVFRWLQRSTWGNPPLTVR